MVALNDWVDEREGRTQIRVAPQGAKLEICIKSQCEFALSVVPVTPDWTLRTPSLASETSCADITHWRSDLGSSGMDFRTLGPVKAPATLPTRRTIRVKLEPLGK
jgi:hypothetical protein